MPFMRTLRTAVVILAVCVQDGIAGAPCEYPRDSVCKVKELSTFDAPCKWGCPSNPNHTPTLKRDSLTVRLTYDTTTRSKGVGVLSVKWEYEDSKKNFSAEMSRSLEVHIVMDHTNYCYCLPTNVKEFVVTLGDLTSYFPETVNISASVNIQGTKQTMTEVLSVDKHTHCWSVMGNRSLEVCGVQIPSPPVNVTMFLERNCSSNVSTFLIRWEPPLEHNTPILVYHLFLFLDSPSYIPIDNFTSNTSYRYSFTGRLLPKPYVQVRAGIVYNERCAQCLQKTYNNYLFTFGPRRSANATTVPLHCPTPGESSSPLPEENKLSVVIPSAVGGAVVVVVVILLVVVAVTCHHRNRTVFYDYRDVSDNEEVARQPCNLGPVFLVASTEEDEEMREKMRYLVHDLADHGIEAVYYEYERASHDPHSPAALGIARWVERQFQRCDLVLFACTQNFLKEWRRESVDVLNPVVWSSRHVLDGILPHQDNMSRFGVVLMGEDCIIPASLKHFQVFSVFDSESDVIHSDQLIRYILETPPYAPPHVSKHLGKFRITKQTQI